MEDHCEHYKQRCKILAPCCNKLYWCRFCHDNCENHPIDRYLVNTMICMKCKHTQPIDQYCKQCNNCIGLYYCNICHLFTDNVEANVFHCDKCKICRVGGRENFVHCDKCGICVSSHQEHNNCIEVSNCPICFDDLLQSRTKVIMLKCGHSIHNDCYVGLIESNDYKCPICMMSTVDLTLYNQILDDEIIATPMPEEYANMEVKILCNECHEKSDVKFHVVGLKCLKCGTYNTKKI